MSTLIMLRDCVDSVIALANSCARSLDPVGVLYTILAGTYGSAAIAANSNDHHMLVRCYLASAVLHELIGLIHQMGF
jgi:hypothetical protein